MLLCWGLDLILVQQCTRVKKVADTFAAVFNVVCLCFVLFSKERKPQRLKSRRLLKFSLLWKRFSHKHKIDMLQTQPCMPYLHLKLNKMVVMTAWTHFVMIQKQRSRKTVDSGSQGCSTAQASHVAPAYGNGRILGSKHSWMWLLQVSHETASS